MNTETKLRGGIAFSLLLTIIVTFFYFQQNDELKKCQTNNYSLEGGDIRKSELQDSLFNLQTTVGRYEMALEILKEKDSISAQKFEYILYTETE